MIGSQIFLGVLGSSIIPRKEIAKLLSTFGEAGLRFVYFSPRNMRRTKEVASQMGIDVAWNCAIF
jgi:predicted HAD superfamily phosphohydrolase YqeG